MKKTLLLVLNKDYPIQTAGSKRIHQLIKNTDYNESFLINVLSLRCNSKIQPRIGFYDKIKYISIGSGTKVNFLSFPKFILYQLNLIYYLFQFKNIDKRVLYCYLPIDLEIIFFIIIAKILRYKIIFDIVEDYTALNTNSKILTTIKFFFVKKFAKLSIFFSDWLIVISDSLMVKYSKNITRITKIPITANENNNVKIKNENFTITYAGSFAEKDNVKLIIRAFLDFYLIYPKSELILIGIGGNRVQLMNEFGTFDFIKFIGFVEDRFYYKLLKNSDALLMCRENSNFSNAGFPFKLGEYLATGNPTICTRVSDIESYLDTDSALLIEPDDKDQLVGALRKIYENPEFYSQIGLKGRDVADSSFNPRKWSESFYQIINNLK